MDNLKSLQMSALNMRGRMLDLAIEMENLLDLFITENFITKDEDKQAEFACMVLSFLTVKSKIEIFGLLLSKNPNFKSTLINQLTNRMRKLNEVRNTFAHWSVDTTPEGLADFEKTNTVSFIKRRPSKLTVKGFAYFQPFSEPTANKMMDKFREMNDYLRGLNGVPSQV